MLIIRFPDVYTHFRVALEKQNTRVRRLINVPANFKPTAEGLSPTTIPTLADYGYCSENHFFRCQIPFQSFIGIDAEPNANSVFPHRGGETTGLAHLHNYIWQRELLKTYKQTRNSLVGTENSTKFSAWSV